MLKGLTTYPNFRPIQESDASWYEKFYEQFDPYADFCFANLLTWININDDLELSNLNGNVVFRFTDIFSRNSLEPSLSILGNSLANETVDALVSTTPDSHAITMVPECFVQNLSLESHIISEDRDNWDYIYDIPTFLRLDGPTYKRLRYQITSFEKAHKDHTTVDLKDISSPHEGKELISLLRSWNRAYQFGNDPEEIENIALQRRLVSLSGANGHLITIRINGQIEGFLITSIFPSKQTAIIHHIKCSYRYELLFDFFFHQGLSALAARKVLYVNLEQDLGIEGLRHHKLLLRPEKFLKKYTIIRSTFS